MGFTVSGLTQDESYEFRVYAKNAVGSVSNPSLIVGPVTCIDACGEFLIYIYGYFCCLFLLDLFKYLTHINILCPTGAPAIDLPPEYLDVVHNISMPIKAAEPKDIPCAPSVVCVSDSTNTSISLEWSRPADDGGMDILGYIIEMVKGEETEWKRVNEELVAETHYVAAGLETGAEYKFRIAGVNHVGRGDEKETPEPTQAVDRLTPPQVDIDATFKQTHIVKAGGSVCLGINFRGKPIPTATWIKEEGELGVMTEIITTDGYSSLCIENCSRTDTGKYTVNLENASGSKAITFTVKVMDAPGAPQDVAFMEVSRGTVTLTWKPPLNDGGARIHHYIAKPKGTDKWVVVGNTKNLTYAVEKLNKGDEYDFRVKAKNEAGYSKPRETLAPVLVKEPHIEPAADLSDITNQLITCRSGSIFTIEVPISGRPAPKVTWKLEEMRLKSSDRVSIKVTKDRTIRLPRSCRESLWHWRVPTV
uniref:Titin n=1 Tax=Seriola lalandi dorsalis TaxID=1841481 RepID=A0A3B4WLL4_SERLL